MHLGVERASRCGIAEGRDRFSVPSLPRESDPEVERRVGVVRSALEYRAKRALSLGELLLLQVSPAVGEIALTRYRANAPFTDPVSV